MLFVFGTNELQSYTERGSETSQCFTTYPFKSAYFCMLNRSNNRVAKLGPVAGIIIDEGCSEVIRHEK